MRLTLAQVRKNVPSIHVFTREELNKGVTLLEPRNYDDRYDDQPYSYGYTEGDGSRRKPYTYKSAAPVSPHYAIVDLWLMFRSHGQVFIQVNTWLLELRQEGVVAEDGHYTKLLPEG